MELGIEFKTDFKRIRFGFRSYGFQWLPGEEESGSSDPAQFFDTAMGDRYVMWSWLWFVVLYARAN